VSFEPHVVLDKPDTLPELIGNAEVLVGNDRVSSPVSEGVVRAEPGELVVSTPARLDHASQGVRSGRLTTGVGCQDAAFHYAHDGFASVVTDTRRCDKRREGDIVTSEPVEAEHPERPNESGSGHPLFLLTTRSDEDDPPNLGFKTIGSTTKRIAQGIQPTDYAHHSRVVKRPLRGRHAKRQVCAGILEGVDLPSAPALNDLKGSPLSGELIRYGVDNGERFRSFSRSRDPAHRVSVPRRSGTCGPRRAESA
jgi:hypothetical protein